MYHQPVSEWMSTPVVTVPPSCTIGAAQQMMEQHQVRRLPVIDHGRLVGIVTRGDLCSAEPLGATTLSIYEWRGLFEKATVAECMSRDVITLTLDATVLDAARLMLEHKISGLPVVDGRVAGMITESDLFRLMVGSTVFPSSTDSQRRVLCCHHCGAELRGRFCQEFAPGDQCWRCHYHLHRCDNCRFFDGVGCILNRPERLEAVPGQHCDRFIYLTGSVKTRG